jgi:hypothetical protein
MDLGSMYYVARIRFHSHYFLIVILAILVAMHTTTTWSSFSHINGVGILIYMFAHAKVVLLLPSVDLYYKKKMILLERANLRIRYLLLYHFEDAEEICTLKGHK